MNGSATARIASNTAVLPQQLTWEQAIAWLQGDDPQDRYYAAWYLGTTREARAVEPLLLALQDERDRTALGGYPLRRSAAKALGQIGDVRAVPGLIEALSCSDLLVREEAAYALAQLGDRRAVQPLLALLRSQEEQPWEAFIEALGHLNATEAEAAIRPFLDHPSERVRSAAAWVLYRFTQAEELTQILVALLAHPNFSLRQAALFDLAESGWLAGASLLATANVALNLRLNALKRLFDVALQLGWVPPDQVAAAIIPQLDKLF
ncbi:HEAT repeat domain-containing protein [Synechococcus sp. O70.1]|jgi:phycocyanobilin lyase alpha subunit|uniref:HEAT repeat domain-containing protein n=1 Tax=unclassified Synechococcus TaxID=2626047 RepID=UPI0039C3DF95